MQAYLIKKEKCVCFQYFKPYSQIQHVLNLISLREFMIMKTTAII